MVFLRKTIISRRDIMIEQSSIIISLIFSLSFCIFSFRKDKEKIQKDTEIMISLRDIIVFRRKTMIGFFRVNRML